MPSSTKKNPNEINFLDPVQKSGIDTPEFLAKVIAHNELFRQPKAVETMAAIQSSDKCYEDHRLTMVSRLLGIATRNYLFNNQTQDITPRQAFWNLFLNLIRWH